MNSFIKSLTIAFALATTLPTHAALDLSKLETIPVQDSGRQKPYLVFAQESLLGLVGRRTLATDDARRTALDVVTDIWFQPAVWSDRPLILIDAIEVKDAAGLEATRKLYSYNELASNDAFVRLLQEAENAKRVSEGVKLTGIDKKMETVGLRLAEFESLRNGNLYRVVANPAGGGSAWRTLAPSDPLFGNLRDAYLASDQAAFDAAATTLKTELANQSPQFQPPTWKVDLETFNENLHPFRWAWIFYLLAGIALAVTSLHGRRPGYIIGWSLVAVGFAFQLFGFVARILIAGRPPVTNMYETVIYVAFGTVLFALIFEAIYRGRYLLLGAIPVAVLSLILADSQPLALDPGIHPLAAVLQSNFWLATHVLIITLSYAAFALALGVAHIALGKVIIGSKPSPAIYNYIYRTLQIGILLLAVGTILGGVWANYSWGRFWDWDPKETWALVALLTYLFILHGRIAGRWAGFGLAVGSVLAFQTIIMAWYGVNFVLGVGLHSYGFGSGGFEYAITFIVFEVAFTTVAILRKYKKPARKILAHA
jgi:ABC-type transport system involved in cytochrome c biogenesis permease subunit